MKRYVYLLQNKNEEGFFPALVSLGFCFCVKKRREKNIILPSGKEKLRVVAAVETHVSLLMRS